MERLNRVNTVPVCPVDGREFETYGRIVKGYDFSELISYMETRSDIPENGNVYLPSDPEMEQAQVAGLLRDSFYGGMDIQVGYCNGHNSLLNALEYHRCGEVNVAVTDLIVLVGSLVDVADDFTYDTEKVEAFFVPAGTAFEMYETTLHYAPCGVDGNGFKDVIILPKGTNADITKNPNATGEDRLLTAENKWLIAHADAAIEGAFNGLQGENISVL